MNQPTDAQLKIIVRDIPKKNHKHEENVLYEFAILGDT